MATKVTTNTVGSWFPSGYYGHYRSRARTDFVNEYRQLAKPQPPRKFIHRATQPASTHVFSLHDNRHSFMSDASYFAQGLGRKRHPERSGGFDPNFMAWTPHKGAAKKDRPLTSTYRQDYRREEPLIQLLTKRPKTSFDGLPTTTYRTVHGADSPNRDLINAMNNEALMLSLQSRQKQAKLKKSDYRETVASCMSWYRPRLPPATCHTDYNHIDMQPNSGSDMNINNSAPSSEPVAGLESQVAVPLATEAVSAPVIATSE